MKNIRNYLKKILFLVCIGIALLNCKNPSDSKSNSSVSLKLFNIKTSNAFYVSIPDTKQQCIITDIIENDSLRFAKGVFKDDSGEKITVVLDYLKTVVLNGSENRISYVIPFTISGQGTGNFKYLGLFELNDKSKIIKQNDSYFIGDRVILDKIEYDGNQTLKVKLKAHALEQSFSEEPEEIKIINFKIGETITLIVDAKR